MKNFSFESQKRLTVEEQPSFHGTNNVWRNFLGFDDDILNNVQVQRMEFLNNRSRWNFK